MFGLKMKKKYNYVDKCPRCGAYNTGYTYITSAPSNAEDYKVKSLYNGELVEIVVGFNTDYYDNNLFCKTCNARWTGDVKVKFLTDEEIEQQRKLRGITDDYILNNDLTKKTLKYKRKLLKQQQKRQKKKAKQQKNKKNIKIKK